MQKLTANYRSNLEYEFKFKNYVASKLIESIFYNDFQNNWIVFEFCLLMKL